ncbi:MAG: Peptidase propeptide [Acidobacteriaceae bacterium]|nr:Peptidase propeptide [Acidobacteriaceae bacterium]
MLTLKSLPRGTSTRPSFAIPSLALFTILFFCIPGLHAQRTLVAAHSAHSMDELVVDAADSAIDSGAVPVSQPMTVTVRIATTPERAAALDQFLAAVTTSTSPSYYKWLTPQQYAASYGATDDQLASLTAWAQSQGLTVAGVSAAKTRLTLSGTADQVQRAFAVSLHQYVVSGRLHVANTTKPSVPLSIVPMVSGISGLDDLPAATGLLKATSLIGRTVALTTADSDPLAAAANAIDANTSPVLTLSAKACATALSASDLDTYRALFRQASAQGITVLATSACTSGSGDSTSSQPSPLLSLPEVTALTLTPAASSDATLNLTEDRPDWQVAAGLPRDAARHQPDLTTPSTEAFAQTLTTLQRETGTRQGNINSVLYSLATTPDLYTQPDSVAAGTWEATTGLGVVNLTTLLKVFPRATGTFTTTTSLTSSSYGITYGQAITLSSKVLAPVYTNASPTGIVTFSSTTQGTLGSATIDSSGIANFTLATALDVGSYTLTATYSGDTNYASSVNTSVVIVAVTIANGAIAATVSPATSTPYGSTATVTATVTLLGANVPPNGPVTASLPVSGTNYSAILSPSAGGNSATANIVVPVPPPGTYQVQVGCAGNTNFVCQTPKLLSITSVKGNTLISVAATPAVPQVGQLVTFSANITNAGNGQGTYNYSGTVTFYDNGKSIAIAAVGSNQATASATLSGNVAHIIAAVYGGDVNWNGSSSTPLAINPTLLPSTLSVTSNVTTTLVGVNVVFTATVSSTIANVVVPSGIVSFFDTFTGTALQLGGTTGAVALTPNGPNQSIARFSTTGLLAGTHSIYAMYNGDSYFASATSLSLPVKITDYAVAMTPATLALTAGQSGQVAMQLSAINGFSGSVSFGCTPPASTEMTCSFSPASLQTSGNTTMTVVSTSAKAKPVTVSHNSGDRNWPMGAGSALAMLLCFILPRRRRALPLLLTALLTLSLFPSLGCGDATSTTPTPPLTDSGTPLGTQIFTITTAGTDGTNTARHNYNFQVTVQ